MTQNLIVYGARCFWWDNIDKAGSLQGPPGHTLPCCPHCHRVLFQMDESEWDIGVEEYEKNHKGYKDFTNWCRGRCYRTLRDAVKEYKLFNPILDPDTLKTLGELI